MPCIGKGVGSADLGVIGRASLVTRDSDPYSIHAGVPDPLEHPPAEKHGVGGAMRTEA